MSTSIVPDSKMTPPKNNVSVLDALASDDLDSVMWSSSVSTCSSTEARIILERAPKGVQLAVSYLIRPDATCEATFSALRLLKRSYDGDPTPLYEAVPAIARLSANVNGMTIDSEILDVIEMFTLEGAVSPEHENDYIAIFEFAARVCGRSYSQATGWKSLAIIIEAIRPGAPSRALYLARCPAWVIGNVAARGCMANTRSRRELFLEYCDYHLTARPGDVTAFVTAGGLKAISSSVVTEPGLSKSSKKPLRACLAGLAREDVEVWGGTLIL